MTSDASLQSEMKSLLLVVIASSVCLSGVSKGDNHHSHRISNVGKPSKNIITGKTSQAITPFHFFDLFFFTFFV